MEAARVGAAPGKRVAMPVIGHHGVHPSIHPSVFLAENASVIGDVTVGKDSSIWYGAVLRGDINAIRIGERTNIQDGSVLHVTHACGVDIGDDVTVGHQAMVHGCSIGNASLIGMSAVVLDNARVGSHALVAAGSVVREGFVVPDGCLVAGVPARVVRSLSGEEQQELLASAEHYVGYSRTYSR